MHEVWIRLTDDGFVASVLNLNSSYIEENTQYVLRDADLIWNRLIEEELEEL